MLEGVYLEPRLHLIGQTIDQSDAIWLKTKERYRGFMAQDKREALKENNHGELITDSQSGESITKKLSGELLTEANAGN